MNQFGYSHPAIKTYGFAIFVSFATTWINAQVSLYNPARTLLALLAVFFSGLYGGFGPSFVTTLLTAFLINFILVPYPITPADPGIVLRLTMIYLLQGLLIGVLFKGQSKADQINQRLLSQFQAIAEHDPDFISRFDKAGRYLYINPAIEKILGKPRQQILGKTPDQAALPEDVAKFYKQELNQVFSTGKSVSATYQVKLSGQILYLHSRITPEFDNRGRVIAALAVSRDITEIKELEQRKDDFMAMTSHELRTPLTSIQVFTELLLREDVNQIQTKQFAQKMSDQITRLRHLVNDLVNVSILESGRLPLNKTTFYYDDLLYEVVDTLQTINQHRDVMIKSTKRLKIVADRDRIQQVLINLLSNAMKFSLPNQPIEVTVKKTDQDIMTTIQDQGIGIAKQYQRKIFDRFFRIYNEVGQTYGGLGMGLYITKQIIKRHGGKIALDSEPGKGATFSFWLPL